MTFGGKQIQHHITTTIGPNRRLNLLCFAGFAYVQCLMMLSHICRRIKRQFSRSVDTLIVLYNHLTIYLSVKAIGISMINVVCLEKNPKKAFECYKY